MLHHGTSRENLRYDEFTDDVRAGKVAEVEIHDSTGSSHLTGKLSDGTKFQTGGRQPILEDARLRRRRLACNDPGKLKVLEPLREQRR